MLDKKKALPILGPCTVRLQCQLDTLTAAKSVEAYTLFKSITITSQFVVGSHQKRRNASTAAWSTFVNIDDIRRLYTQRSVNYYIHFSPREPKNHFKDYMLTCEGI